MRKTFAMLGSAAALVLTLATTSAQAAQTAPAAGYDRCPAGSFCIFDGANGTGTIAWFRTGSPDLRGQSMDNRTSSYWNRTNDAFALYDGYNYGGSCWSVFTHEPSNLTGRYPEWDNRFSSLTKSACG
ncbi:peptidase inhibitor family I36 protein [Streptomyces sp. NPDC088745]|uniref:peptidase inhibitor family I36 protein n=1 Tax=Streptomyces sp. NPDC088745 TaxID=3365884 RepID=UPI003826CE72